MNIIEKNNSRLPYSKPFIEVVELLYENVIASSDPIISEKKPIEDIIYDVWD